MARASRALAVPCEGAEAGPRFAGGFIRAATEQVPQPFTPTGSRAAQRVGFGVAGRRPRPGLSVRLAWPAATPEVASEHHGHGRPDGRRRAAAGRCQRLAGLFRRSSPPTPPDDPLGKWSMSLAWRAALLGALRECRTIAIWQTARPIPTSATGAQPDQRRAPRSRTAPMPALPSPPTVSPGRRRAWPSGKRCRAVRPGKRKRTLEQRLAVDAYR